MRREIISKIKSGIIKFFWFLGEQVFVAFLILMMISLLIGGFIFYKYYLIPKKKSPSTVESPLRFNEKLYKKVLEKLKERERKVMEADLKTYPDPFKGVISSPSLTENLEGEEE